MTEERTILTPAQEKKLAAHFEDLVALAESPPPKLDDFNDPAAFNAAETKYKRNPLREPIKEFHDKWEAQRQAVDPKAEDAQKKYDKIDELYEFRVNSLRQKYLDGIKKGAPNEEATQKQQGAFDALMNGDWMGAIKLFLLSIPFVGDFLAAGGKWLKSQFSDDKLTFVQSQERIILERSLGGAAANLGIDAAHFRYDGIMNYENPQFEPQKRPERQKASDTAKTADTSSSQKNISDSAQANAADKNSDKTDDKKKEEETEGKDKKLGYSPTHIPDGTNVSPTFPGTGGSRFIA